MERDYLRMTACSAVWKFKSPNFSSTLLLQAKNQSFSNSICTVDLVYIGGSGFTSVVYVRAIVNLLAWQQPFNISAPISQQYWNKLTYRDESTLKHRQILVSSWSHSLCSYDNNSNCISARSPSPVWQGTQLTADCVQHTRTHKRQRDWTHCPPSLLPVYLGPPSLPPLCVHPPLRVHPPLPKWHNPKWSCSTK